MRAMPPAGSIVVVMVGVLAYRPWEEAEEAWSSHPGMSSSEAMHGESTQARSGRRAGKLTGVKWRPVTELLVFGSKVGTLGVTRSEQRARYSENRQTRSVRLS